MAAPGFGTSPFILPNSFDTPGNALQQGLAMQDRRDERKYEIDYRNQRNREADDWRKLNLIRDLTDLDKYQTGEAAADAIGNQSAADVLQRYTAMASTLSPSELQGRITQDMQKTIGGMQAMKGELVQSDKDINSLKQLYPGINTAKLRQEHRKEILGRRLKGDTDFENPLDVNPSSFQLNNPDFLSYFVDDPKKLFTESIRNPKFTEKGVAAAIGSPNQATVMEGDLPFFRKLNYDPKTDIKDGFLKKGINPQMDIIKEPTTFRGNQIEVLGKEPFSIFEENNPLELRSLARQKYPDYDLMSDAEKETARREVALDNVRAIDKSGFSFKSTTKPPHYSVNVGGSNSDQSNLNNIYERIKQKGLQRAKDYAEGNYFDNSLLKSDLDADELEVVLKGTQNKDLTPEGVKVIVEENGRIGVYNKDNGERLVYLNQTGTNLPKQANVAGKKASVEKGNEPYKPVTINPNPVGGKKRTYKGLDKDGNPIFE